jgi:hypothetical protein
MIVLRVGVVQSMPHLITTEYSGYVSVALEQYLVYQVLHLVLHCTLCCRKLIRLSRDLGETLFSPTECEIHAIKAGGYMYVYLIFFCYLTITHDGLSLPYNIRVAVPDFQGAQEHLISCMKTKLAF